MTASDTLQAHWVASRLCGKARSHAETPRRCTGLLVLTLSCMRSQSSLLHLQQCSAIAAQGWVYLVFISASDIVRQSTAPRLSPGT